MQLPPALNFVLDITKSQMQSKWTIPGILNCFINFSDHVDFTRKKNVSKTGLLCKIQLKFVHLLCHHNTINIKTYAGDIDTQKHMHPISSGSEIPFQGQPLHQSIENENFIQMI